MVIAAPQSSEGHAFWHKLYRLGPALLYAPMIAGSIAYSPSRHDESWLIYIILAFAPLSLLWHVALIATEQQKPTYVLYLLLNAVLYPGIAMFCLYRVVTEL